MAWQVIEMLAVLYYVSYTLLFTVNLATMIGVLAHIVKKVARIAIMGGLQYG